MQTQTIPEPNLGVIQELSQQMLKFAEDDDWERLPELEKLRDKAIKGFFEGRKIKPQESENIGQVIQSVLEINNQINILAEQKKTAISAQLQGFKQRQNVNSAYLQHK